MEAATRGVRHRSGLCSSQTGRDIVHIPYFHIGDLCANYLGDVLKVLNRGGVEWCATSQALEESLYAEFERDLEKSGLVTDYLLSSSLRWKASRWLIRASERYGAFGQSIEGPRWPYL